VPANKRGAQGQERSRVQERKVDGSLITPATRERPQSCGERLDVSQVCLRGDAALDTNADSDGRRRFGVTLRGCRCIARSAGPQGEPVTRAAGVAYALTVVFTPGEGQLSIGLGGHEWIDAAVSGAIGLAVVRPVLPGTAHGIWKENQLDKEVWQVIDERVSAPAEAGSETPTDQPGST
jgi:hypothetical protein